MKIGTCVLAVGSLVVAALASGCAKPDWIQQTLVTVDVTGQWVGSIGKGNFSREVWLKLEQQGSKVTGTFQPISASLTPGRYGPIDGAVSGDVFSFQTTSRSVQGKMTVSGDEMNGSVSWADGPSPIFLRRVDSPSRPSTQ